MAHKMDMPKVSIIVPIYNVEKYLDRCMQSLFDQTLKDIEIILVDDGSPDNCPKMCDEYAKKDSRVKVIHKKNAGLGYARNSGLDIATGEFVGFVDSDDYVCTKMYEELYTKAIDHKVDGVLCSYYNESNGHLRKANIDRLSDKERSLDACPTYITEVIGGLPNEKYRQHHGYSVWKMIFSNEVIQKNNIRFKSEREFVSEDILFQLDFSLHASKLFIYPEAMYYYCANEGSLTKRYDYTRFDREILLYQKIGEIIKNSRRDMPDIELRMSRLLMYKAFYSVCDTIKYLPYMESIKQLNKIVDNTTLHDVLATYPIWVLPSMSQKVFYYLLRFKCVNLVYFFYKLKHIK